MSYADKWTDEQVEELEERIARLYSEAQKDFKKQADAYFAQFAKRDDEMREKVESGEVSKEEYKQWRLTQMGRGERLNHMARQMAERATKANEVAVAYVNDATPGIYSLNRNHEAYEIEKLGHEMVGADFSLYNEQAVRRIMVEDPDLMPYYPVDRALKRGIDLAYGQQYIKRHITGGIIQGKSVYDIADDLQRDVANMNRASAVRTARTAMTAAQNGGRQATMDSARAMGIKLRKRWVSAKDARVRDAHGAADGQTVETDKPFIVGGERMMFPGDRTSASAWNFYNCRCGMRTVEKEGIEAEPRKVRIQNPAWTDAHEAEEKAKAKYERALEKEKAEIDPEKKKALRKARLEKQHEYERLQQKRREIPKNMVVNDMTYTEWAKLRGVELRSYKTKLTSPKNNGKIKNIKAQEKHTFAGTRGFSREDHAKLLADEKENNKNKHERAMVYGADGKLKFVVDGVEGSVQVPSISEKGCVITHNHPTNEIFSSEDIYALKKLSASEIRASTNHGTYALNPPLVWRKEISEFEDVDNVYNYYMDNSIIKYKDIAAQNGVSLKYYLQEAEENALTQFADDYGFDFRLEEYK